MHTRIGPLPFRGALLLLLVLLIAPCRVLNPLTGFFDLLSGLLYRLVDFLAGALCRALLLLSRWLT